MTADTVLAEALAACLFDFDRKPPESFVAHWASRIIAALAERGIRLVSEDSLDAAWAEAEAALPEGVRLTAIIEAWSASVPGRRVYHDGLLHGRTGLIAALRTLAARLSEGSGS